MFGNVSSFLLRCGRHFTHESVSIDVCHADMRFYTWFRSLFDPSPCSPEGSSLVATDGEELSKFEFWAHSMEIEDATL